MKRVAPALLVIAAVIFANAPLLMHGYAAGTDARLELVRVVEYRHALDTGQRLPLWAPDLYRGFGSPIFLFYAPLFAASAAMLMTVLGSAAAASIAVLILFTAAGTWLMWRFVLEIDATNRYGALAAAVLFALQPYLLADKFQRNANAEFIALSLFPGILLGYCSRDSRRAFAATFASLAAVILAHNITALVAASVLIGVALFLHRPLRNALPVFAGMASAIGVTAFFWYPALRLQPLIRPEELLVGKFDFHVQFPPVGELFGFREYFAAGPLVAVVFASCVVAAVRLSPTYERRVAAALLIAAAVTLVLTFRVSTPAWEHLPLLRFAQFPWRLAGPFALLVTATAGIVIPRRTSAAAALIVLAVASALPSLLGARAVTTPEPTTREIASGGLRTTAYDEYLPRAADGRVTSFDSGPILGSRGAAAVRTIESGADIHMKLVASDRAIVIFRRWQFPVWAATIDSAPAMLFAAPRGAIAVRIPPGSHDLRLELIEPRERRIGEAVTAASALVVLAFFAAASFLGTSSSRMARRAEARGSAAPRL